MPAHRHNSKTPRQGPDSDAQADSGFPGEHNEISKIKNSKRLTSGFTMDLHQ